MEKLQIASIEFVGYISGDYESFCFDVNREDFIKITGEEPVDYNQSLFNDGTYRIYPTTLFSKLSSGNNKYKIKIVTEEVEIDNSHERKDSDEEQYCKYCGDDITYNPDLEDKHYEENGVCSHWDFSNRLNDF